MKTKLKQYFIFIALFILSSCAIKNTNDLTEIDDKEDLKKFSQSGEFTHYRSYQNWTFLYSKTSCALVSYPLSSFGNYLSRDLHYMYINYNKNKVANEIAIISGKTINNSSLVKIELNNYIFLLQPLNDVAWANNEAKIINEMLNLSTKDFLVYIEFLDNSNTIDKFSIEGFKEAFLSLQKLCI